MFIVTQVLVEKVFKKASKPTVTLNKQATLDSIGNYKLVYGAKRYVGTCVCV